MPFIIDSVHKATWIGNTITPPTTSPEIDPMLIGVGAIAALGGLFLFSKK